jgi:hypothetical protein
MQSVRGSVKHVIFKGDTVYIDFSKALFGGRIEMDDIYNEIKLHHHFYELHMAPEITKVIIDDKTMPVREYLTHYKEIEIPDKFGIYVKKYDCSKDVCKHFMNKGIFDHQRFFNEIDLFLKKTIYHGYYNVDIKLENICYQSGNFFWIDLDPKFFKSCAKSPQHYHRYMMIQLFVDIRKKLPVDFSDLHMTIEECYETIDFLFKNGETNVFDSLNQLAHYNDIDLDKITTEKFLQKLFSEQAIGFKRPPGKSSFIGKALMTAGVVGLSLLYCAMGGTRKRRKTKRKRVI